MTQPATVVYETTFIQIKGLWVIYPFDRQPRNGVDTLQQFLTPNMAVQDVTIQFTDCVIVGPVPK